MGPLYLRLTAVVLGTLSVFGVTVMALHALALGHATVPLRLEALRLVGDEVARDPEGAGFRVRSPFRVSFLDDQGRVLDPRGDRWLGPELTRRGPGEYCDVGPRPCYAVRAVTLGGRRLTAIVHYHPPRTFFAPLTVAFLASVLLWLVVSAAAGLVLLSSLRKADQSRRRLLSGLAHDLGTPLTSIRGFAETLLRDTAPDSAVTGGLRVVYREAVRMQGMVDDMLVLSRLEVGRMSLVLRPLDLREVLEAAADRAALAFGRRPALHLTEAAARLQGDRDRLDQVLANLVDNAYRYGDGGEVQLRLTAVDSGWRLEIQDEGPGMTEEARRRAFQPFERGDRGKGSGLGLAIARELVELHGGQLRLEPAEGGGCRAVVDLPGPGSRSI